MSYRQARLQEIEDLLEEHNFNISIIEEKIDALFWEKDRLLSELAEENE